MICTKSRCFFAAACRSNSSILPSRLLSMPPKLLDRRSSYSSTSSQGDQHKSPLKKGKEKGDDEDVQAIETLLSKQRPKPCHTCGREITPRHKWAVNWSTIKYCSDKCKKGGKKIPSIGQAAEMMGQPLYYKNERPTSPTWFEKCLFVEKSNLMLDREAWIEATLMHLVKINEDANHAQSSMQGRKVHLSGVPLYEVSQQLHQELIWHRLVDPVNPKSAVKPTYITCVEDNILRHVPGERERIRRVARRLIVFPLEQSYFAKRFGDTEEPYAISLKDASNKFLETCHDVSFAKGEMFAYPKQR
jgi:hypothetical protein